MLMAFGIAFITTKNLSIAMFSTMMISYAIIGIYVATGAILTAAGSIPLIAVSATITVIFAAMTFLEINKK